MQLPDVPKELECLKVKFPYCDIEYTTKFCDCVVIMISQESMDEWINHIIQNSHYAIIHIFVEGNKMPGSKFDGSTEFDGCRYKLDITVNNMDVKVMRKHNCTLEAIVKYLKSKLL
jgi:hypothetical protein